MATNMLDLNVTTKTHTPFSAAEEGREWNTTHKIFIETGTTGGITKTKMKNSEGMNTNAQSYNPTPIDAGALYQHLEGYNQEKREYLFQGFKYGFRLGCNKSPSNNRPKNHFTVDQLPEVAKALIENDREAARYAGPFDKPPFKNFQVSPLKLTPKKKPGEFRLLHNLSHPYDDTSVNSAIPDECSKVTYATIQDDILTTIHCKVFNLKENFILTSALLKDVHLAAKLSKKVLLLYSRFYRINYR